MIDSATMPAVPTAVVDVLNGLLEGEVNSVFRFIEEGSPHLGRATATVRRPLHEMVQTSHRHAAELTELIDALGGTPVARSIKTEEQYLAFLSLRFLLPKLIEAKKLTLQRYENALRALKNLAPAEVIRLLGDHLAEHRAQLAILERAAEEVAKGK